MKRGVVIFWSIFALAAIARVAFSFFNQPPDIGGCLKQIVSGTGTVETEPERKDTGQIFIISADEIRIADSACANYILIRVKAKSFPRFKYGEHVSFGGKLSAPFNFKSDTGRSFDYKGYLAKDDVYAEIKSAAVEVVQGDQRASQKISSQMKSTLYSIKRAFVANLEGSLGEPHAALAAGLVVGEKAALGPDLIDDFRTVGLIHIVVLSGYNITIVGYAMRRVLSFLPRAYGIAIGGAGIMLFGVMVGGGATVVRSCIMAGIALSASLIRRDYSVIRALMLAALIMLIQNPLILFHDPSFQLSFLATFGLILLASPIEDKLQFIPDKLGMRGTIASTLATQVFVSPYILYMMGQISIIGAVVNILVLPFIPVTMLFVFLCGAGGMVFQPLSIFFGWIAHLLLSYELFMVENFARMPFAAAYVPAFSGWFVIVFYAVFAAGFLFIRRKQRRLNIKMISGMVAQEINKNGGGI